MDSVHLPWGWLVGLVLGAGLAGLLVEAFDDDRDAVSIGAVTAESGSSVIEVGVLHRACGLPEPEVFVDEDERVVELRAVYDESGDCEDAIVQSDVAVELDRPLGARVIEVRTVSDGDQIPCVVDGEPSDRCLGR